MLARHEVREAESLLAALPDSSSEFRAHNRQVRRRILFHYLAVGRLLKALDEPEVGQRLEQIIERAEILLRALEGERIFHVLGDPSAVFTAASVLFALAAFIWAVPFPPGFNWGLAQLCISIFPLLGGIQLLRSLWLDLPPARGNNEELNGFIFVMIFTIITMSAAVVLLAVFKLLPDSSAFDMTATIFAIIIVLFTVLLTVFNLFPERFK